MNINQLILRNLRKNLKNYYLYVFALIFSVALYFAFVTLQYDPSMDEVEGSIKGAAAIRSASILLVAIVTIFLLYANRLFIKRRSKEIGLFQLIGMTKHKIFRILSVENFILYFSSLLIGIFIGFSASKLIILTLYKIVGVQAIASLQFSSMALIQTLIVFSGIFIIILLLNISFIRRQSILSLFRVTTSSENKVKKLSIFEMIIGTIGIASIILGYYVSSKLFSGDFKSMNELFFAMIFILGTVIIGTYLFYKGSVSFLANAIRRSKGGYLNINEILSLSSIMFRMKSNAFLLTIITTVSALAIGLLSLSYISYYSAEKSAMDGVPAHFALFDEQEAERFEKALQKDDIEYNKYTTPVIQVDIDVKNIMDSNLNEMNFDTSKMTLPLLSEDVLRGVNLSKNETVFTGYTDILQRFMSLKESGTVIINGKNKDYKMNYLGLKKDHVVPYTYANGGLPAAIVDKDLFEQLKDDVNPEIQKDSTYYIGINIKNPNDLEEANKLFHEAELSEKALSRLDMSSNQKNNMGLIMFIVGFLGLTFLITSGCILYFKQMDESEDEKGSYTILRKLGFTQTDLLRGIQIKQLYNFGIPLIIGLLHSYFAVQSGWFLFGTELWTPMIIVMVLYTGLYSIFGLLSVLYYKKVIKEAL
ncbi:ABC transporter permease [Metabacillus malikii]|uniref:Bacitracin transport system permease protein n=1 Tax=Metabacillus malikii TaxID=1504265 RepID=A0ABT9ZF25_9BACI|nr:ABC transporter permease [Metabacillus malikii]MDQ0230863.1 bacitracin transport system permease protein [Metabacillus malikii]